MKVFILAFAIVVLSIVSIAQEEWTLIHPYPTIIDLFDTQFVSDDKGWIVGKEGLIMQTTDGGITWNTQHRDADEYFEAVFFINENEGWVCGWGDIYHTIDGGETWELQNTPPAAGGLTDIFFINQDTGWIVGYSKTILKTLDGGESWIEVMTDTDEISLINEITFHDADKGCLVGEYLGGSGGGFVMSTQDGGLTWTETTPNNCAALKGVNYYNEMCIWICGRNGGVYRSLDGGNKWFMEYNGLDDFNSIYFFDENNGMLMANNYVRLSFDGGYNWDSLSFINTYSGGYRSFMSWEEKKGITVGFNGLISLTENGGNSWTSIGDGIRMASNSLGFFDTNNGLAIHAWGHPAYLLRTYDGGYTWLLDTLVPYGQFYDMLIDGQSCYLLNKSSQLVKSYNAGVSWEVLAIPTLSDYYSDFQFVNENTGFICGYHGEFLSTQDGGQSWESNPINPTYNLRDLFFVDENHGWLIYYDGKEILRTTDGGNSWLSTQIGSPEILQPLSTFFLDQNIGFLTTQEGFLHKTDDGGVSWEILYEFDNLSSEMHFFSESEGFCTDGNRIFHTMDGGQSWSEQGPFGSTNFIISLFFLTHDIGWLGGSSGLIAKYDGTVGSSEIQEETSYLKIYPNPACQQISIRYPKIDTRYSILVYDMFGRMVSELPVSPGQEESQIDVSDYPPGMYSVMVKNENKMIGQKKFIVIR